MANLITALQQEPSVSSANYVAEFWCINHCEMLGTGREWGLVTKNQITASFPQCRGSPGFGFSWWGTGMTSPNGVFRRAENQKIPGWKRAQESSGPTCPGKAWSRHDGPAPCPDEY